MNLENLETINFELRDDGVGIITLNRPERLNAMSFQFTEDFNSILDYLMVQIDCRVVILRGAGRGFCSGLDLKEFDLLWQKEKLEHYKKIYYANLPELVKRAMHLQWRISQIFVIIDDDELKIGTRRDGGYFGINALITKLSTILVITTISLVFNTVGWAVFEPNNVTPEIVFGLRSLMFIFPAIALVIGLLVISRFPITKEKYEQLNVDIEKLHAEKRNKLVT